MRGLNKMLPFDLAVSLSTLFHTRPPCLELWLAGLEEAQREAATGRWIQALVTYQWLLLELPPAKSKSLDLAKVHNGLAEIFSKQGDLTQAASAYDKALSILETLPKEKEPVLIEIKRALHGTAHLLIDNEKAADLRQQIQNL